MFCTHGFGSLCSLSTWPKHFALTVNLRGERAPVEKLTQPYLQHSLCDRGIQTLAYVRLEALPFPSSKLHSVALELLLHRGHILQGVWSRIPDWVHFKYVLNSPMAVFVSPASCEWSSLECHSIPSIPPPETSALAFSVQLFLQESFRSCVLLVQ